MKTVQRVVPFYFGVQGRQLFGCFHEPSRKGIRTGSVLICQPVGHEYINSHRALRQLATRLAEAGFPVLRFDYYGCGDSCGDAREGSIARWLEDISTAVAALQMRAGRSPLYVVGLRLGGTLAALGGIQRDDLAGLILWDPVMNGNNYFQELISLQKEMLRFRPKPGGLFRASVRWLRKYADRPIALAQRTFAHVTHSLRVAVVRWRSAPYPLPSVRTTTRAKLVSRVHGLSAVTACRSGLAQVPKLDHQPHDSFRTKNAEASTEVLGFPVSNILRAELEELDLLRISSKPAPRVLLVQTKQTADVLGLRDRLIHTRVHLEHQKMEAPQIWLPTTDGSLLVPAQVLQSVVSWICGVTS